MRLLLETVLPDLKRPTKAQLEKAMQGHILEKFELIGISERLKGVRREA